MATSSENTNVRSPVVTATGARLTALFVVDGSSSLAATLLLVGIFFYTKRVFGWGLLQNFLLAAAQGVVYVTGALLSARLTRCAGRRAALRLIYLGMALVAGSGAAMRTPMAVAGVLVLYTLLTGMSWPALESLVSSGVQPHALSRRIGIYNLIWSSTGALAVAVQGSIITIWPAGVFVVPALLNASSSIAFFLLWRGEAVIQESTPYVAQARPADELQHLRRLALWLSRICLPATYVVVYSLSAMLPSLPVIARLPTTSATLIGSVWSTVRTVMFVVLGTSVWWHARPRILLGAAVLMLVSFVGVVMRPSLIFPAGAGVRIDLLSMVVWQALLGTAIGMIYCASLYFGMVLSEGSTEHGGYHEALIGCGQIVGPLAGASTQLFWPGSIAAGAGAVGGILIISVAMAGVASVVGGRR